MRAVTVNESENSPAIEKMLKQKESLLKKLEIAKEKDVKAEERKEQFIKKYGESAWWANMENYDNYKSGYYNKNGRYPGYAVWNGEGPIMRAINNAANQIYSIEDELEEIEEKLVGVPEYPGPYTEKDIDPSDLNWYNGYPEEKLINLYNKKYELYTSAYKAGYLYGDKDERERADSIMGMLKGLEKYLYVRFGSKQATPIIVKAESWSDQMLSD